MCVIFRKKTSLYFLKKQHTLLSSMHQILRTTLDKMEQQDESTDDEEVCEDSKLDPPVEVQTLKAKIISLQKTNWAIRKEKAALRC